MPDDLIHHVGRINRLKVGGIVLCGGLSTRMGRSKADLPFGPEALLQRVVRILGEVVTPIVVVAASGQKLPELPNSTLFACDERPQRGPLEGLAAGLSSLPGDVDAAFVTSCDAPFLSREVVRLIAGKLAGHELAVPLIQERHQVLTACYRVSVLSKVRELLAQDRLRPFFLVELCQSAIVSEEELRIVDPGLDSFRNTNTPADYLAALELSGFTPPDDFAL